MIVSPYSIQFRKQLPVDANWSFYPWDIYVSAYNSSDRVKETYEKVPAKRKVWIIHGEYDYSTGELPSGYCFMSRASSEADFIKDLVADLETNSGKDLGDLSICVDITGFMRPHLLFLALYLKHRGVKKYDVLYSEPKYYSDREQTTFSEGAILVRQIEGFAGVHETDQRNDLLIIGSGYDDRLIKAVAENKDKADKAQIFGLPSLRADMYQENVMRARKAADAVGENKVFDVSSFFAPANDPFVTAETLSEIVRRCERKAEITNLYLSPLATKPQALGFALYYLSERRGTATSILFPTSSRYAKETSVGLQRVWQYTVELP